MNILKNLVLPTVVRNAAKKGSKFLDAATIAVMGTMVLGDTVVVPFIELANIKGDAKARQLSATIAVCKNYFKGTGRSFKCAILETADHNGIAVQLSALDEKVAAEYAAANQPAAPAAEIPAGTGNKGNKKGKKDEVPA